MNIKMTEANRLTTSKKSLKSSNSEKNTNERECGPSLYPRSQEGCRKCS